VVVLLLGYTAGAVMFSLPWPSDAGEANDMSGAGGLFCALFALMWWTVIVVLNEVRLWTQRPRRGRGPEPR